MTKELKNFYSFAYDYLLKQTEPLINEGKISKKELEEYTTKTDVKKILY